MKRVGENWKKNNKIWKIANLESVDSGMLEKYNDYEIIIDGTEVFIL